MTTREGVGSAMSADGNGPLGNRVHHVRAGELEGHAAISGGTVGSKRLWMGLVENAPLSATDNHHHGESEAGIYVVSGHPVFVFHDGIQEVRISADPGDFLLVPPIRPASRRESRPERARGRRDRTDHARADQGPRTRAVPSQGDRHAIGRRRGPVDRVKHPRPVPDIPLEIIYGAALRANTPISAASRTGAG
jgi:uncharacterized RmlC-like cupin family protein